MGNSQPHSKDTERKAGSQRSRVPCLGFIWLPVCPSQPPCWAAPQKCRRSCELPLSFPKLDKALPYMESTNPVLERPSYKHEINTLREELAKTTEFYGERWD